MRDGMARPAQLMLLGSTVLAVCACQSTARRAPETNDSHVEVRVGTQPSSAASRDLSRDEAAGGHVLGKHVGRSDKDLQQRLERESSISGASTYTDRPTAENAIGAAIEQNHDRIQRWLNREGGHTNLVLDYDARAPIGRTLNRGETSPRPCSHAVVVLRYDPPASYHVLTSYPECRP